MKIDLKKLEIRAKHLSASLFPGGYTSRFKGRGLEFCDLKEYEPGDDVRTIDWNVTARKGSLFIKRFQDERDIQLHLLIDVSASLNFGKPVSKKERVIEIAALIATAAFLHRDSVGLMLFSDKVEEYIPPSKGETHTLKILSVFEKFEPSDQQSNLAPALEKLGRLKSKPGITIVLSDFLFPPQVKGFRAFAAREDLLGISVNDPLEKLLPKGGILALEDLETRKRLLIDTDNSEVRQRFEEEQKALLQSNLAFWLQSNCPLLFLSTQEPYFNRLREFLARK